MYPAFVTLLIVLPHYAGSHPYTAYRYRAMNEAVLILWSDCISSDEVAQSYEHYQTTRIHFSPLTIYQTILCEGSLPGSLLLL